MCVAVGMKLPRDKTNGKPTKDAKWRLAKIRDRAYDPVYKVRRYTVKEHGASQLFLVDTDSDWTEGVSVHEDGSFLSMVNSALNNYVDKKDGAKKKASTETVSVNGLAIRKALKSHNIEAAIEILQEYKLDGATLITDGDRLFLIETTLPLAVKEKYMKLKKEGQRFEDIIPKEEYVSDIREIKDDYLIVTTNTGIYHKDFGYQPDDGDSYESSIKRRKYAMKALRDEAYEPLDLVVTLSKLGREEVDKNAFFRPLRLKGEAKSKNSPTEIYTTSIIQIDPSGTMIVKPVECKFDINNTMNLISDKYLTHLVILPHRSRMFETFKDSLNAIELKKRL